MLEGNFYTKGKSQNVKKIHILLMRELNEILERSSILSQRASASPHSMPNSFFDNMSSSILAKT